jgi:hypothetical protein
MHQYSSDFKHHILSQYSSLHRGSGFSSLAHQYNIPNGAMTIKRWHDHWDGTIQSLQHKKGAGRPHIMNQQQVKIYVKQQIQKANQSHIRINYRKILNDITNKTALRPSIQTIRRYGKEQLGVRKTKGVKRTADESK